MARNRFITHDGFPFFIQKEPNYREIQKRMYFLSTTHIVSSWFVVLHLLDLLGVFSFLSFVSFPSLISHNASLSCHSHKSQFTLIPIIPGGLLFPGGPSGPLSPLGPDIPCDHWSPISPLVGTPGIPGMPLDPGMSGKPTIDRWK